MKVYKDLPTFPIIRRHYSSYRELGQVIGRSESYINNRLNGRGEFTNPEKIAILIDMNLTVGAMNQVFGSI